MTWRFKDLREYIAFLESKGELRRITTPVSQDLEITEIADRVVKQGGPALLFENVSGSNIPVFINMFGTMQRTAWAMGVENVEEVADRVRALLAMAQTPPTGFAAKLGALRELSRLTSFQPKTVNDAPCQEVVLTSDDVDVSQLPVLKCWPLDAGRFITFPLVITRDPATGDRNLGTYRMQVFDHRTTGMHWHIHKAGAHHQRLAIEKGMRRLEAAAVLGGDPVTMWTGTAPLPPGMDELLLAGFIRGERVELVRCRTVDLEVPAQAEIVLEGYVVPAESRTEGPFGDHTGYYSPADEYPVFHVTAMTHRRNPTYPTTIVGRPLMEDYYIGKITERIFLPVIQMTLPEVVDINQPAAGVFHNLVIVSIKKEYPGQARKVMYALWGLGMLAIAKNIIVVDHFVNVHDLAEVAWRVANNIDPVQDVVHASGPLDDLDHASPSPRFGSKMGIDATAKGPLEGRQRPWPPEIVMSPEIKALVDRKWKEYGLE
ncbi:MAG: menaquinone biosynthesis decarboxylase [Chloroflexi bacterium]|nr:menaquinone biosynthesis decarboxylase [Chloroflexota bacterium]